MSRIAVLSFIALFYLCWCCVISATPVTSPENSSSTDGTTNNEYQHETVLHTLSEQQQQYFLHSMITELLTKVLIDPFKQILTMVALYLEVFSVASGAHILSSANTSPGFRDREQQLIAIASTNLWLKLPLMEQLNNVFLNSSMAAIPSILDNSSAIPSIIDDMFASIEKTILANELLAPLYREEKAKAEKLSLPPLVNGTGNPDTVYETNARFRAFIVRRQLLEHLQGYDSKTNNSVQFQRHALSRAVMQLAKTANKSDRIQQIFDRAVQTTMDKIDPTSKTADTSGVIDRILFSTLEETFGSTAELEGELAAVKNDLVKKYKA